MKSAISHLLAALLLLLVTCCVGAQTPEDNLLVVQSEVSNKTGFPGQVFSLALNTKKGAETFLLTQEGYEVEVIQGNFKQQVTVRHAGLFSPAPQPGKPAAMYRQLNFILPYGLVEGEAVATAIYQGQHSNEYHFKVSARPVTLMTGRVFVTVAPFDSTTFPTPERRSPPPLTLEIGKENPLYLSPLFDPDDKDAELLVTCKQNDQLYNGKGRVVFHGPNDSRLPGPSPWEALVRLPDGLVSGEARLELRVKISGVESEPTTEKVLIKTSTEVAEEKKRSDKAQRAQPPRLIQMDPKKASVGQVITLLIEKRVNLEPSPGNARIVIEQENRSYELKPLFNSAIDASQGKTTPPMKESEMPVFLVVRLAPEVIGKVTVRILNPAQGPEAGLSNGLPLEIMADVTAPSSIEAQEVLRSEIEALNKQLKSAQGVQPQLSPRKRYIKIRAEELSLGGFPEIRFEQAGQVSTYTDLQNLLVINDTLYLALPDKIEPGEMIVYVANRVEDRASVPARVVVQITRKK